MVDAQLLSRCSPLCGSWLTALSPAEQTLFAGEAAGEEEGMSLSTCPRALANSISSWSASANNPPIAAPPVSVYQSGTSRGGDSLKLAW
jgi:hypothetical protein